MTDAVTEEPIRTCIGCGESAARTGMLRLQTDSDGELRIVSRSGLVGRTAYLHRREDCIRALERSKRLYRSLRKQVDMAARSRFVAHVLARDKADLPELTVG